MKAAIAISRQRQPPDATEWVLHKPLEALEHYITQLLANTASQSSAELNPECVENNSVAPMSIPSGVLSNSLELPPVPWSSFEWLGWDWNELVPQA